MHPRGGTRRRHPMPAAGWEPGAVADAGCCDPTWGIAMTERDVPEAAPGEPGEGAAEGLVRVVRAWRHGAVNRLQVALGWLQMGRPERAAEALDRWCRQLQWEGAALRQWPPEVAALYLIWRARCEEAGIEVTWQPPLRQATGCRHPTGCDGGHGRSGAIAEPAGGRDRGGGAPAEADRGGGMQPAAPPSVAGAIDRAPVAPAARDDRAETEAGIVAQVAAALEAAWAAGRTAPGSRIWLRWDGSAGVLRWGLEAVSGAVGPR